METGATTLSITTILKNFSYLCAAFVSLGHDSYTILAIFMIIDTITGILRSGTIHGYRSVTSHNLSMGIVKKGLVIIIPLLIAVAGQGVGINLVFLAKSTLSILILSELYSILSNIQSIRLKRDVQEFDAVNFLLSKLRDILEKTLKKTKTDDKFNN